MGVGRGTGEKRASDAVKAAIESPMLETTIQGAKAILLYVAGGYDLGMLEVSEIASLVEEQADRDCILIFGAAVDEEMKDEIAITVIATGFDAAGAAAIFDSFVCGCAGAACGVHSGCSCDFFCTVTS